MTMHRMTAVGQTYCPNGYAEQMKDSLLGSAYYCPLTGRKVPSLVCEEVAIKDSEFDGVAILEAVYRWDESKAVFRRRLHTKAMVKKVADRFRDVPPSKLTLRRIHVGMGGVLTPEDERAVLGYLRGKPGKVRGNQ